MQTAETIPLIDTQSRGWFFNSGKCRPSDFLKQSKSNVRWGARLSEVPSQTSFVQILRGNFSELQSIAIEVLHSTPDTPNVVEPFGNTIVGQRLFLEQASMPRETM